MNDLRNGTSVSVTMVTGGSATNVIPAYAKIDVDTRTLTVAAFHELSEKINALEPYVPGAKLTIHEGHGRGPMERNAKMIADYQQVKAIGASLGLETLEDSSGGGSDGNFTAMLGISTLDGLGPQGDGLHALHEHVVIASMPRRSALIAGMLRDWKFSE
jgi:glutamate carboxypeptidase